MCRHVAYLGPPITLGRLLFEPPFSLERQAWAPRDMRGGGTINADGFGVGWYLDGAAQPVRYRRDCPLWTDPNMRAIAGTIRSGAIHAAVRSATAGMPVVPTAAAPFTTGRWLFSHNGRVEGWPGSVTGLARRLPPTDLLTLDAPTDSALLWALLRDRLRRGSKPPEAVRETVREVSAVAPGSTLNLLLSDGRSIVACTAGHALSVTGWSDDAGGNIPVLAAAKDRLRLRSGDETMPVLASAKDRLRLRSGDAVLVTSEPLDDGGGWRPVPDRHLIVARPSTVDTYPLEAEPV